ILFPITSRDLRFQVIPTVDHSIHPNFGVTASWNLHATNCFSLCRLFSHTISHHYELVFYGVTRSQGALLVMSSTRWNWLSSIMLEDPPTGASMEATLLRC
ncbi:hypothetical protein SETIT_3G319500v2, partial [Setaria italica]